MAVIAVPQLVTAGRAYSSPSVRADDNALIGEFRIPVPKGPKRKEEIDNGMQIDESGILTVTADCVSTGAGAKRVFNINRQNN